MEGTPLPVDDRCLRCGYEHTFRSVCPDDEELTWREEVLQRHRGHDLRYYSTVDHERRITVENGLVVVFGEKFNSRTTTSSIWCHECAEELITDSTGELVMPRIEP